MKNVTIAQFATIPTINVNYSVSVKTNYANFKSASMTQNCDALINLLDGICFLIDDCEIIGEEVYHLLNEL